MNKKRIFAIVVFIILGLFMYTFANPLNDEKDDSNANQSATSTDNNVNTDNSNLLGLETNNNRRNTRRVVNNNTQTVANNNQAVVEETVVVPTESTEPVQPVTPAEPVKPVDPITPVKPEIEDKPIDLTIDKINAITELKGHKGNYSFEDETEYNKVIDNYSSLINESTTKEDIKKNLADGKEAIDTLIEEDLKAYKDAAKDDISTYAKELDLTTDITEILDGFFGDIDDAKTKKAVDDIVTDAKAKLDEIKASEIAAAKEEAKTEINNYKKDDEKNLSEIVDAKNEALEDLKEAETIEDINKIVDDVKEVIDDIINNKKYTVIFYGIKGKKLSTEIVGYKKAVTAPTMKKNIKEWNNSISLEFEKWDVEDETLNAVTSDLEVHARYKVLSATTKISILKEGKEYSVDTKDFAHPYNKPEVEKDTYFNLTITDEITKAVNEFDGKNHLFVYFSEASKHDALVTDSREAINEKIREVVDGEPNLYNNNKYKELQYYVLKLQGDRFHCDARVIYNKEAELADKKTAALEDLRTYKLDDEKYITEITTKKSEYKTTIENAATVIAVDEALTEAKNAIDNIINNKKFKVTFVGFNNKTEVVEVGYNKDAVAPTTKEFTNPVYRNVTYKLTGWDNSLKNIKTNTTITASYEIEKVVATVFLIDENNEDCNIPKDRSSNLAWECYKNFKTIEIKATKEIKEAIANDKKAVIFTSDEAIRAVDKNSSLPTKDGKYKTYEFYVMKFIEDSYAGFHIDGKLHYDKDAEALANAKDQLKKLIDAAKDIDTTGKTTKSINDLNTDIQTAERAYNGNSLEAVNAAIVLLTNIELENIEVTKIYVTNNKKKYFENESYNITVTYDDNNGTKGAVTTDYKVTPFDKKEGKHKATVTYGDKEVKFEYKVVAIKAESLKVVNKQYTYYVGDKENIVATLTYNNGTSRVITAEEYRLDNFVTTSTTEKGATRKCTVVYTGEKSKTISDKFEYVVVAKPEPQPLLDDATIDKNNIDLIKKLDISLSNKQRILSFKHMTEDITVMSIFKTKGKSTYRVESPLKYENRNKFEGKISETERNYLLESKYGDYVYVMYEVKGRKYTVAYTVSGNGNDKKFNFEEIIK